MAESLIMYTCTGKQDSYPRLPFSAILGCTSTLAPATDSPQFMADPCECHTMPGMSPRRVDSGNPRPYLSLTVSRKTCHFGTTVRRTALNRAGKSPRP